MTAENVQNAALTERAEFELGRMLALFTEDEGFRQDIHHLAKNEISSAEALMQVDPDKAAELLVYGAKVTMWAWWVHQRDVET